MDEVKQEFSENVPCEQGSECCVESIEKQVDEIITSLRPYTNITYQGMIDEVVKFGHWCSDTAARDKRYELASVLYNSQKYRELGNDLLRELAKIDDLKCIFEYQKQEQQRINLMRDCIKALKDCEENASRSYVIYDMFTGDIFGFEGKPYCFVDKSEAEKVIDEMMKMYNDGSSEPCMDLITKTKYHFEGFEAE